MLRLASLQHQPASLVLSINARRGRQRARSITMATAAAGHTVAVVWFRQAPHNTAQQPSCFHARGTMQVQPPPCQSLPPPTCPARLLLQQ